MKTLESPGKAVKDWCILLPGFIIIFYMTSGKVFNKSDFLHLRNTTQSIIEVFVSPMSNMSKYDV